jgi:RHH-type rel operon transcriptional repressor/antitoxin RelB
MIAIELDTDTEKRLERLAATAGLSTAFFARKAILEHLDDLEDVSLATQRLQQPAKIFSAEDVKHELGL